MSINADKTIEQLREENEVLVKAIERFAFIGAIINPEWADNVGVNPSKQFTLVAGDFRKVLDAFEKAGGNFRDVENYYVEGYSD